MAELFILCCYMNLTEYWFLTLHPMSILNNVENQKSKENMEVIQNEKNDYGFTCSVYVTERIYRLFHPASDFE